MSKRDRSGKRNQRRWDDPTQKVNVRVERYEETPGDDRLLVFGEADDGEKVSFHVTGRARLGMKQALDAGAPVEVVLDRRSN